MISDSKSVTSMYVSRTGGPRARRAKLSATLAVLSLCGSMLVPGAVRAEAITGSANIAVSGDKACVEVERAPFRMRFFANKCKRVGGQWVGSKVLEQVPNTGAFLPIPATTDIEVDGTQNNPDLALYAPLVYEVGVQQLFTFNRTSWVGNMYTGGRGGYAFAPTHVLSAETQVDLDSDGRKDDGVRLVLATNEVGPGAGRVMIVTITPDGEGAMRVRATLNVTAGVINIGDSFVTDTQEAFHGFGGRHVGVDMRGRRFYSWVEQENLGGGIIELGAYQAAFAAGGTPEQLAEAARYMYPNGPMAAYYPQNLFVSSQRYGMLVANPELTRWRLQKPTEWQLSVASAALDYTVAVGAPERVVKNLTRINGRNRLPPEWAEGPTISRTVQTPVLVPNPANPDDPSDLINLPGTGDTPDTYLARINDDLAQIEAHDLPISAYAFEGWSVLQYALDSEGVPYGDAAVRDIIARLKARGIRPIAYVRPYFSTDGLLTQELDDFAEVINLHLVTRRADGSDYIWEDRNQAALLDLTNATAQEWLRQRLWAMLDLGFDGFHSDFGEQVTDDMVFANGETGLSMHNKYPVLLSQITRGITDSYERSHRRRGKIFFFSRAGYSGRSGSAAFDEANHPGDATTDWTLSSGIASQIPDMLNRSVGGAYGFDIDIGGYADFVPKNPERTLFEGTTKELFIRWSQLAALTPYFRVHNSSITGVRQPWSFDDDTREIWRQAAELHLEAVPYMRAAWKKALETGMPVVRPLWLAFPNDPNATRIDQQYMLGKHVLVAPVVTPGATTRDVYLPAGCWQDANTGESYQGSSGRMVTVPAPLEWLPYFVTCGREPFRASQCGAD